MLCRVTRYESCAYQGRSWASPFTDHAAPKSWSRATRARSGFGFGLSSYSDPTSMCAARPVACLGLLGLRLVRSSSDH
jgi:hypothetical protein